MMIERSETSTPASTAPHPSETVVTSEADLGRRTVVAPAGPAVRAPQPEQSVAALPAPPASRPPSHSWRKPLLGVGVVVGLAAAGYYLAPSVIVALNTVSTDDAYVNGHVTFVAPRVAGHVTTVLVDNNQRVKSG